VIHGLVDPLVRLSGGIATAAAIPGSRLLVFNDMAHDLPPTRWHEMADAIAATPPSPPDEGPDGTVRHDRAVTIYFEDFTPGRVFELGAVDGVRGRDRRVRLPLRPAAVPHRSGRRAETMFGGIIASGWHTCSMCMRLLVDGLLSGSTSLGSPGMEQIRWLAPVRPGDRLTARTTVEEARPSSSKPDRGTVTLLTQMENQDGVVVMTMRGMGMYSRRPA
jgi:acyl dehydratase